ncbi:MAG TPA: response regulator [bacterium]|jgi:two-component system chemotaxis response regulator CheY|nr:response regulator [bacterium]
MLALVVDDSLSIRLLLTRLLQSRFFTVETASGGLAALERLRQRPAPDLMVLDWNMPDLGGLQVLSQARAMPGMENLCVMMATAETDLSQISAALEAGVDEYLMKPFDERSVDEKLELLGFQVAATA